MQPYESEFQDTPIVAGALRCIAAVLAAWAIWAVPSSYMWSFLSHWLVPAGYAILATCIFLFANPIAWIATRHRASSRGVKNAPDYSWKKFMSACTGLYIAWRYFAPALVRYATSFNREYTNLETGTVVHSIRVDPADVAKLICYALFIAFLLLGRDYVAARLPKLEFVSGAETDGRPDTDRQI